MPYSTVTLTDLQARLVERTDSSPYWTSEQARLAINEALRIYNLLTGVWKQRIVLPTVKNQIWYTIPSTLVYRIRIELNEHPLDPTSTFELDQAHGNWESHTTTTGGILPTQVAYWIPKALNLFGIWPADAAGGNSLSIDGVRATPILITGGSALDLSASEHDAILAYALHALSYSRGAEGLRRTWPQYRAFLQACADQNDRLLASQFFRQILGYDQGRRLKLSSAPRQASPIVAQVLETMGMTAPQ